MDTQRDLKRILLILGEPLTTYTRASLNNALPELYQALKNAQARLQTVKLQPATIRKTSRLSTKTEFKREAIGEIEGYITCLEITIERIKRIPIEEPL